MGNLGEFNNQGSRGSGRAWHTEQILWVDFEVKDKFIKALEPFNKEKSSNHAVFKGLGGLSGPYCLLSAVHQLSYLFHIQSDYQHSVTLVYVFHLPHGNMITCESL